MLTIAIVLSATILGILFGRLAGTIVLLYWRDEAFGLIDRIFAPKRNRKGDQ